MALQIIQRRLCDGVKLGAELDDFMPRHDPPVPGTPRIVAGDEPKLMTADLCDACDTGPDCLNRDEMRVVVREFGTPFEAGKNHKRGSAKVGRAKQTTADQLFGVRQGRPANAERDMDCLWCPMDYTKSGFAPHVKKHGFNSLRDALGTTCPACGQGPYPVLSVHVLKDHDHFASVTDGFMWARDNGDPHGVYRERRAAGQNIVESPS
ncbi:hypothetical protein ACFVWG_23855 [Kribbella sp. NPDC058245]|uniref:hypothetical protein n=1 Tax=Kribbella sp. NPDC058245 TaxID=3346399 RepID=UPI0036ED42BD